MLCETRIAYAQPPDATLTPPLALRDACQILREIIQVYDTSLVDPADRSNSSTFAVLLGKAIDPSVEMCERMAELRKGATDWDKDIFLINCLGYLQQTLTNVPFTTERAADLDKKIQRHVESMTYEHVSGDDGHGCTELMPARQPARPMRTGTYHENHPNEACGRELLPCTLIIQLQLTSRHHCRACRRLRPNRSLLP